MSANNLPLILLIILLSPPIPLPLLLSLTPCTNILIEFTLTFSEFSSVYFTDDCTLFATSEILHHSLQ